MVKYGSGDALEEDLLLDFLGGLPNLERVGKRRAFKNKYGGLAQHLVFKTLNPPPSSSAKILWHGTTYQCLEDILSDGFKNPFDKTRTFQEFIEPGIYLADELTAGGAMWHACSTRFSFAEDNRLTFARIVLKVGCVGQPMCKPRLYGDCYQHVYDAAKTTVHEVHVFRGLGFYTRGDHFFPSIAPDVKLGAPVTVIEEDFKPSFGGRWGCELETNVADGATHWDKASLSQTTPIVNVAQPSFAKTRGDDDWRSWQTTPTVDVAQPLRETIGGNVSGTCGADDWVSSDCISSSVGVRPPPPPPEIEWEEFIYNDLPNNRRVPFYHHRKTGVRQWEKPAQPFVQRGAATAGSNVGADWGADDELKEWVTGDRWSWDINLRCNACDAVKPVGQFSKASQKYGRSLRKCKECNTRTLV